jgi:hypothetical protein
MNDAILKNLATTQAMLEVFILFQMETQKIPQAKIDALKKQIEILTKEKLKNMKDTL